MEDTGSFKCDAKGWSLTRIKDLLPQHHVLAIPVSRALGRLQFEPALGSHCVRLGVPLGDRCTEGL